MSVEATLKARSESKCELCGSKENLAVLEVNPSDGSSEQCVLVCEVCHEQITDESKMDANHWHCLNDSMWNPTPAVQVMAYRLLKRIVNEGWPQDLLDSLYLEDEVQIWADAESTSSENSEPTRDSNGNILAAGDTVTLIKDLNVKGAGFTAKQGTVVKNIRLTDNPKHIEGKINGSTIVLVAAYLKKTN
ncbi:MAG: PhnA domain-containing protein [Thiovulaceae bacterium]|nr:PhnA domain-containing protein [Sulfurimonadaceae bacterium]